MRDWFKKIREEKGLTQAQVAEKAGFVPHYICMIESGRRGANLPPDTAKRIAGALDFPWTRFYE